ncbi:hypothetical protein WA158_004436 [Blastocystis sp. Blastoise]
MINYVYQLIIILLCIYCIKLNTLLIEKESIIINCSNRKDFLSDISIEKQDFINEDQLKQLTPDKDLFIFQKKIPEYSNEYVGSELYDNETKLYLTEGINYTSSYDYLKSKILSFDTLMSFENLTSFRLDLALETIHLYEKENRVLNKYKQYQGDIIAARKYYLYVKQEIDYLAGWRTEWQGEVNAIEKRYQEDIYIMNLKLAEFGIEYNEEKHSFKTIPPVLNKASKEAINNQLKENKNIHLGWSQSELMNKELCKHGSSYLYTDYADFSKENNLISKYQNEYELRSKYHLHNKLLIIIPYDEEEPSLLLDDLNKRFNGYIVKTIKINKDSTNSIGVYNIIKDTKTEYILFLDQTVRLTKYSRIDALLWAVQNSFVDIVGPSEEDENSIVTTRCYKLRNKYGKMTHMAGYHNAFSFTLNDNMQNKIFFNGQICFKTSLYMLTKQTIFLEYWIKQYPLNLALQAVAISASSVYFVGHIPYVTVIHEFSEKNLIYKALNTIPRSIREQFGERYNINIFIDQDKRFTWMPAVMSEFRSRNNGWRRPTPGMVNPLYMLGGHHDNLMKIDEIARLLNIPYSMIAGNLLSGIAFGGVFPWEFDTDFRFISTLKPKMRSTLIEYLQKSTNNFTLNIFHPKKETISLDSYNKTELELEHDLCGLLRDMQPHIQDKFNSSGYIFHLRWEDYHTCARITRSDFWGPYCDIFYEYKPLSKTNFPSLGPFKKIKYLGHLVSIPSNWRELLQYNYGNNVYRSNMANNNWMAWPQCPKEYMDHPNCIKNSNDLYEYIDEFVDDMRNWPEVN